MLRDLFPDPDIVCRYLECDQLAAVNWFLDWLVLSLEETEFHPDSEDRAVTRIDLLKSLRHRDSRDKLASGPPPYIMIWTRLLGSWPSITQGGCRFLIQCREWFLVQIRILARARLQWMDNRVLKLPGEDDLMYARFGLSPEQLGSPNWREPCSRRNCSSSSTGWLEIKVSGFSIDLFMIVSVSYISGCLIKLL